VSPGSTTATVTWSVPADDGSPITGYTIVVTSTSGTVLSNTSAPASDCTASTCSAQVTGLPMNTDDEVQVEATNAVGTGPASTKVALNVLSVPPPAPKWNYVMPDNASVDLAWQSNGDGGEPIIGWVVNVYTCTVTAVNPCDTPTIEPDGSLQTGDLGWQKIGSKALAVGTTGISADLAMYTYTGLTNRTTQDDYPVYTVAVAAQTLDWLGAFASWPAPFAVTAQSTGCGGTQTTC